ncbi:NERD domain-containing protein [Nocardia araoensis]|uniref:NERD domain-containing protein n=1 Tax=Nocardia araoensis TaxID=228600 RepID=UPI0002D97798|nr:NERD domain-containing protein [Nocardia araoensis]
MLVINERTTAPRSEQRVLDWMRTWTGQYVIVGLAISGCYLPDRERKDETQEADLVVITPRAAVVIEVKGTVPEATSGVLSVQANGRWRLSGYAGDPIHVRDHDSSPFDQVTNNVFNLKALVRKHNAEAFVDGLIVVVPPRDSNLTLNIESRRRGCAVVLGAGQADLRAWFHRTASRKLIWTAERTHALLTELNLGDQVTVDDLVADGFPPERKLRAGTLAALDSVTRKAPELEGRASGGGSDADDVAAGSTPGDAVPEQPDAGPETADAVPEAPDAVPEVPDAVPEVPDAVRDRDVPEVPDAVAESQAAVLRSPAAVAEAASAAVSGSTEASGNGDEREVDRQVPESDESLASPAPNETDATETGERHEDSEPAPSTRSGSSSASQADRSSRQDTALPDGSHDPASEPQPAHAPATPARASAAEVDPFAPEFLAPEPVPAPASSDTAARSDRYAREEHRSASYRPEALPDSDVSEHDRLESPRFEGRLAARPAREGDAEPYADEAQPLATGAAASIRRVPAEPAAAELTDNEPYSADEDFDPAARSGTAPSSFTDSWSSWIDPAPDRPLRPRPVQAPVPSRPASWSTPTREPEPLRRPTPTAVLERRPRVAVREQLTALSARIPGRGSEKSKPRGHRTQQIAAIALIVLVIGTLWILAASCSTPTGGAVQPTPAPVLTTEAVPPPPTVTETPARMNLLPLCTPRTPEC